jgi:pyrroline-5-carboxylate reductase
VDENKKALVDADVVFVAVKPQILEHVCTWNSLSLSLRDVWYY